MTGASLNLIVTFLPYKSIIRACEYTGIQASKFLKIFKFSIYLQIILADFSLQSIFTRLCWQVFLTGFLFSARKEFRQAHSSVNNLQSSYTHTTGIWLK